MFELRRCFLEDGLDELNVLTDGFHPLVFAAKANSDDTPKMHQALNGPDSLGFREAMDSEMESLASWILGMWFPDLKRERRDNVCSLRL